MKGAERVAICPIVLRPETLEDGNAVSSPFDLLDQALRLDG